MSEQKYIILPVPEKIISEFEIYSAESGLSTDLLFKSLSDYVISGFTNNLETWIKGWRNVMDEIDIADSMDELEKINSTRIN